ncbi:hypothetical protein M422DRAFT_273417 [Sphaerobolus stellatus SS14]|uniref:Uncharacterized protein n=1 Tax=Sphaerobolus stellatus (strain SS14) TaxID=990650 RepID=A0A0C9UK16_SPHS4|nr:hypothetical protein M422DRAFT_273417 [Sphaerobolus stellatus SS14]
MGDAKTREQDEDEDEDKDEEGEDEDEDEDEDDYGLFEGEEDTIPGDDSSKRVD